jgi:hypothetical protein
MRNTLPDEMTDDRNISQYVHGLYDAIDGPESKWLPAFKSLKKYYYGYKLHRALGRILKEHQQEQGSMYTDTIQVLLDRGEGIEGIISVS